MEHTIRVQLAQLSGNLALPAPVIRNHEPLTLASGVAVNPKPNFSGQRLGETLWTVRQNLRTSDLDPRRADVTRDCVLKGSVLPYNGSTGRASSSTATSTTLILQNLPNLQEVIPLPFLVLQCG